MLYLSTYTRTGNNPVVTLCMTSTPTAVDTTAPTHTQICIRGTTAAVLYTKYEVYHTHLGVLFGCLCTIRTIGGILCCVRKPGVAVGALDDIVVVCGWSPPAPPPCTSRSRKIHSYFTRSTSSSLHISQFKDRTTAVQHIILVLHSRKKTP